MKTAKSGFGPCRGGPTCAHDIIIHWNESERRSQKSRFDGGIEPQYCDGIAYDLWLQIIEQTSELEKHIRIDVPLPRVLSRLLGVYRAAATLKLNPMRILELSVKELARIAGYSKSHIEAALRWLGSGVIYHKGKPVAQGLGVIERTVRTGRVSICGRVRGAYRTSRTGLTKLGCALLGLVAAPRAADKKFDKQRYKQERRKHLDNARRTALGQVKDTIASFWGRILKPKVPSNTVQAQETSASEAMGIFERHYMNEARKILARHGKSLGSCEAS